MIGWVAKDNTSYGFSVEKYGPQKGHEPGKPDVGNGVLPGGGFVTGNDPRDTSLPAPPDFIGKAVRYVVRFAGKADGSDGKPGVKYWALDNEPMLWHATHRDVFPEPLGYDELWKRTVAYAEAIHAADPTAKVAGFCSWGWTDLYYSAKDAGKDNYHTKTDWAGPRQDAAGRVVHQAMRRLQEEERQAPGRRAGCPLVSPRPGQGQGSRTWARDSTRS